MRIVSLLPSATEIVCALGLRDHLVGVTHECDYPPSVRGLPAVTRTFIPADANSAEVDRLVRERMTTERALYALDHAALDRLRPDLIVTQALCDVCAVAESEVRAAACALPGGPRVVNLTPQTLEGVYDAVREVAAAAGVASRAEDVVAALSARIEAVATRSAELPRRPRVALLEWLDPPFSCGHWTPDLVRLAGGDECLGRAGEPSRTLAWADVAAAEPEVVVVACCGYDVGRAMADVPTLLKAPVFADTPAARAGRVYVTDGNAYFNRPGPRLVDGLEILAHAIAPEAHPLPAGLEPAVRIG